jgi:hypothetical protein
LEEVEHDAGEVAFEGAQGFGAGVAASSSALVVELSGAGGEPDLGDRYPV